MKLKREQPFEQLGFRPEVEQVDGPLPVDFLHQMIPLRDDRVFMPLLDVHAHRLTLRHEPFFALGVDHHALPVLHQDAAPLLPINHRIVRCRGVNVTLVATHRPLARLWKLPAAILNARVVALLLHLHSQLEILQHPAPPDEKLIVLQLLRPRRGAHDLAVFHLPQLRIAIPAGEVFAIEERFESILGGESGKGEEREEETFHDCSRK